MRKARVWDVCAYFTLEGGGGESGVEKGRVYSKSGRQPRDLQQGKEDHNRTRTDHSAENFAILSHIALNLLKAERTLHIGIKSKRLKCGWSHDYLLKVLLGPRPI